MTGCLLAIRELLEPDSGAASVVVLLAIFYMAVVAVLMRHVGVVLRALLDERDPEQRRILRDVLRELLEPFRRRGRR
jgi:hypothetical protein